MMSTYFTSHLNGLEEMKLKFFVFLLLRPPAPRCPRVRVVFFRSSLAPRGLTAFLIHRLRHRTHTQLTKKVPLNQTPTHFSYNFFKNMIY